MPLVTTTSLHTIQVFLKIFLRDIKLAQFLVYYPLRDTQCTGLFPVSRATF